MLNRVIQIDAEISPRLEQRSEIGSNSYHRGITAGAREKLNPALFRKGLLDVCRRAQVTLCDHTKV